MLFGFKPIWKPEDHVSFSTAAEGWGLFRQHGQGNRQTERIELRHGKLRLKSLVFPLPENTRPEEIAVTLGGQAVPAELTAAGSVVCLTLDKPVVVRAGGVLDVAIRTAAK